MGKTRSLVEHYGDRLQLVPFALCGLGLLAVLADWKRPSRRTDLALRVVVVVAAGSLLGLYQHLQGNLEFARELAPDAGAWEIAQVAFTGGNPLLASGVLIAGAALVLAASYAGGFSPAADPAGEPAPRHAARSGTANLPTTADSLRGDRA